MENKFTQINKKVRLLFIYFFINNDKLTQE